VTKKNSLKKRDTRVDTIIEEALKVEYKQEDDRKPAKVYSEEQKRNILNSEKLQIFIRNNYSYMEKVN